MHKEQKTQVVSVRLNADIIDKINSIDSDNTSDFIKRAIDNELAHSHDSGKEYREMTKKINSIDAEALHKTLGELVIKSQVNFEELRKQNEVLKLIIKRSSLASGFSGLVLDELKKSDGYRLEKYKEFTSIVDNELKEIKF